MLRDTVSLPLPLLLLAALLLAAAVYFLGYLVGVIAREMDRRRTFKLIHDISNSLDRHEAMMAQAEADYLARMGLTSGEQNAR